MEILEGFKRETSVYKDDTGYLWILNKKVPSGGQYFHCYEKDCTGTCSVSPIGELVKKRAHSNNHRPDPAKLDQLRFLALIRKLAATTNDTFKDIFSVARRVHRQGALLSGSLHDNITIMKGARSAKLPEHPKSIIELGNVMLDKE